nr:asparagine synthase C-terminal domain-containing protein [Burkholderia ambifaria]
MRGAAALTDAGCAVLRARARDTAPIDCGQPDGSDWRLDPRDERIAWGATSQDDEDLDVSRDDHDALIIRRGLRARRPLYFRVEGDRIEWDQDPLRLLRTLGIKCELDVGSLLHLLWRGRPRSGHALLHGIQALQVGEALICAPGAPPVVRRFAWPLQVAPVSHDPSCVQEEALSRLRASVDHVADAARGIALFLSGGVDSGLLAALLRERHAVTGYTIAFDDDYGLNETDYAAVVARITGIRHRIVHLDVDHARQLLDRVLAAPFPLTAPAAVTHAALIEATVADGHAVAVSGLGADECFGGYQKPLTCLAAQMHHQRRLGVDLPGLYNLPTARLLGLDDVLFLGIAEFFSLDEMRRLSRDPKVVDALLADDVVFYRQLLAVKPQALPTEAMSAHEYVFRIGELLLPALADNALMHGTHLDFPFLREDVYGWASAIDPGLSYWYEADAWWAKRLLRQVAARYLPPEIVMRKRQVLLAPIAHWLLDLRFRTRVLDEVADSDLWRIAPLTTRFRTTLLSRLRAYDHLDDDGRWHEQLWAILVLCGWINRHSTSR